MNYTDIVYGKHQISDKVIIELIKSPALKRLKKIQQSGYFHPFFKGANFSRFEHSIGDYLLLKIYGAPIEEQIAGLIHDVSHLTFSHCIDYVFGAENGKTQGHQDNNKTKVRNNESNFDAKVYCKSRVVDPFFSEKGKIMRVSEKNLGWKELLAKESKPKEYYLKFLD
jgi:HD superfamily phosphohydrolase